MKVKFVDIIAWICFAMISLGTWKVVDGFKTIKLEKTGTSFVNRVEVKAKVVWVRDMPQYFKTVVDAPGVDKYSIVTITPIGPEENLRKFAVYGYAEKGKINLVALNLVDQECPNFRVLNLTACKYK